MADVATVMGPEVDVAAAVYGWVAGGLSEKKLASTLRGSVDKRLVFEWLTKAASDKGMGLVKQTG